MSITLKSIRRSLASDRASYILLAGIACILFGYQNCALDFNGKDDNSSTQAPPSEPFAFDSKVDHIAYMSCTGPSGAYDRNTYFTFRMRGYGPGAGVKLTDEFNAATATLEVGEKASAITNSPMNQNVSLQFALRSLSAPEEDIFQIPGSQYNTGYVWGNLSQGSLAFALARLNVDNGERLRNFAGESFSATLSLGLNSAEEANLYSNLDFSSANLALSLTYHRSGTSATSAISVPTPDGEAGVYGEGFVFSFDRAKINSFDTVSSSNPTRVLNSVTALNMQKSPAENAYDNRWGCPTNFQFRIVPREQYQLAGCADPANASALVPKNPLAEESLSAARVILDASGAGRWIIDPNNRCVFPAVSSAPTCYGTQTNVQWQLDQSCSESGPLCAHYLSICKRN